MGTANFQNRGSYRGNQSVDTTPYSVKKDGPNAYVFKFDPYGR